MVCHVMRPMGYGLRDRPARDWGSDAFETHLYRATRRRRPVVNTTERSALRVRLGVEP